MNQSSLSKELGVKDHRATQRVFCASTPEDPRPWVACLDSKGRSLSGSFPTIRREACSMDLIPNSTRSKPQKNTKRRNQQRKKQSEKQKKKWK